MGFDLYVRLLAQAVEELRDQGKLPAGATFDMGALVDPMGPSVQLDLPLNAGIPAGYITADPLRLQLYRRIASLHTPGEIDDMHQELADRFGPPPPEVENLLFQVKVKVMALRAGVTSIGRDSDQLVVRSEAVGRLRRERLQYQLGHNAHVGANALWIAIDGAEAWRQNLLICLDILTAGA